MKVLDANYLVDYLDGDSDANTYYEANGGAEEFWVMPAPASAEALVGVGTHPTADVERAIEALSWGKIYDTDGDLSVEAARIANEISPQGPYLDWVDAVAPRSAGNSMRRWVRRMATSHTRRRRRSST